jgi:hypothetical protein
MPQLQFVCGVYLRHRVGGHRDKGTCLSSAQKVSYDLVESALRMTYSSSSHEGDAAHQSCSVETGAGDNGGVHEEERRQEESLCTVEG